MHFLGKIIRLIGCVILIFGGFLISGNYPDNAITKTTIGLGYFGFGLIALGALFDGK